MAIPIGIVGAGRSRNGLGPFIAQFLERAGCVVAGVAGRSTERAVANAEELGRQLAHRIEAFPTPRALCASGVAALVVASPPECHLEALETAGSFRLPVLCEKPLVHESHGAQGALVLETFARLGIPLMEHCQWPYLLAAFEQLHGAESTSQVSKVEMGLRAPRPGREMVQNALSHLLSVIQRLMLVDAATMARDVHLNNWSSGEARLRFRLSGSGADVEAALHLTLAVSAPREAWLAIDGRRMDRRVGEGHQIAFFAGGRNVNVVDPTQQLVRQFARLVDSRDPAQTAAELDSVRERHRLYRQILGELV